ncbi:MAG TPA: hypothetical protein VMJ10_19585 [Kofleriaceae bacterium]|nr:hypothetical protein [Kofleriaceae bacterium]
MRRGLGACVLACACGRVGFDATTGGTRDGSAGSDSELTGAIAWAGSFLARDWGPGTTDTFSAQAHAAGNAFVLDLACHGTVVPTAVSLTAPGWTIDSLDPITESPDGLFASATFGAVAPDTAPVTFTVTWTGTPSCSAVSSELGDEFTANDPTGGATTFEAHTQAAGTANCTAGVTTAHANDAMWGGCYTDDALTGVGAGYAKAGDDHDGDWSEYNVTTDPAGTAEQVRFVVSGSSSVTAAIAIKPR